MGSMRHHTVNAGFFAKAPSKHCGYAKGPSKHCGTGVSPVDPHGSEARGETPPRRRCHKRRCHKDIGPVSSYSEKVSKPRRGVTLLELLVILSIFSLMFAILVPSLSGGQNEGMAARCLANLRETGVCTALYMHAQRDRKIIPWYQFPAHDGYSASIFTSCVFGGFKAPKPDPDQERVSDSSLYPAEIRPLNKYVDRTAYGNRIIDFYICPSDRSHSTPVIGEDPDSTEEEALSSWEANGTSYPLNTRWAQGYALPSGNFGLDDFHAAYGTYPTRIAKHMLGGEASEFIMWVEHGFYSATYRAGPTIAGIGGGSQPMRYGWHRKFSAWSVGFADGHAMYGTFDTRQIYGLGGTIWQPNFRHGL